MRVEIDTNKKTLTLLEKVTIGDLINFVDDLDMSYDMSEWSIVPKIDQYDIGIDLIKMNPIIVPYQSPIYKPYEVICTTTFGNTM